VVVVVEEDLAGRESLGQSLRARGFQVRGAHAAEALDCVRASRAAVVVLALANSGQMLDLVRRLRGRFEPMPLPLQPRIVLAGAELDDARAHFALRLGADVVLGKLVTDRQMAEAVDQLVRKGARPSHSAMVYRAG
jgi:CheY-like chemotaxis protein